MKVVNKEKWERIVIESREQAQSLKLTNPEYLLVFQIILEQKLREFLKK